MKKKNKRCSSLIRILDIQDEILRLQMENLVSSEKTINKINLLKQELLFLQEDSNDDNRTPF